MSTRLYTLPLLTVAVILVGLTLNMPMAAGYNDTEISVFADKVIAEGAIPNSGMGIMEDAYMGGIDIGADGDRDPAKINVYLGWMMDDAIKVNNAFPGRFTSLIIGVYADGDLLGTMKLLPGAGSLLNMKV